MVEITIMPAEHLFLIARVAKVFISLTIISFQAIGAAIVNLLRSLETESFNRRGRRSTTGFKQVVDLPLLTVRPNPYIA